MKPMLMRALARLYAILPLFTMDVGKSTAFAASWRNSVNTEPCCHCKWWTKCVPFGGFVFNKDPLGRRNGQQPQENMRNVLKNAMTDTKELINKKFVLARKPLTLKIIEEALNFLRGVVYPMQLPPNDTIRMEFMNTEDLSGTQASREVIEPSKAQLWFAGRQVLPDSKLRDFIGVNDKTKVIVKLNSYGEGPLGREPVF